MNKELEDFLEVCDNAHKEVMAWPKWKRTIKLTRYSTGFYNDNESHD
jgi:hypothetical protein